MNNMQRRFLFILLVLAILLNATSLLNEILEPDGALYAAIAKRMVLSGDWMNLYGNGADWLDKPHLPFWLAACSMHWLGCTAFAYKLPAFLCFLGGVWYTYRLACLLYNKDIALLSIIIYTTALHTLLANFDVRAEAYLTAFIIAAVYHLYLAATDARWIRHILLASLFSALAIMTKGIFVLVSIGGGVLAWWAFTRQWRQLLLPRWWLFVILTLLLITPELYCLYQQFDLHPEKIVFGRTGTSGIRFFFWDSQFGRFFNNGPIQGQGDLSFFLHTLAWAFLPWSVLLYIAVVQLCRRKEKLAAQRWVIWGSAVLSFLLFSLSKFQLPHYIVILFPHFGMITAAYLAAVGNDKVLRRIHIVQQVLLVIMLVLLAILTGTTQLVTPFAWVLVVSGLVMALITIRQPMPAVVAGRGFFFSLVLFLFLNLLFYPRLLHYQAGMEAGKLLAEKKDLHRAVMFRCVVYSFEYYAPGLVSYAQTTHQLDSLLSHSDTVIVLLPATERAALRNSGMHVVPLREFNYFHVSQLSCDFLSPSRRNQVLEHYLLVSVFRRQA